MNSFVFIGWLFGVWYMTKGKYLGFKPVSFSDLEMKAKHLIMRGNPTTTKLIFHETVIGGKYEKKAMFDLQFGGSNVCGTGTFEYKFIDNEWVVQSALADYTVYKYNNEYTQTIDLIKEKE